MMVEKIILSEDGYNKLVATLNFMKTKKRREVADQLEFARSLGDLRENAEYETAKADKQRLESRIAELEAKIVNAKIVDMKDISKDAAYIGATLELKNLDTGEKIIYTLVSQDEADFEAGKISVSSPIGKGLLGKKLKEIAEIQIPAGKVKYQILKISRES